MAVDHRTARCGSCAWARTLPVVVSDGFAHNGEVRTFSGVFCHIDRPARRVHAESFCPDFQSTERARQLPGLQPPEQRGRRGSLVDPRSDD